ncbi:MAG: chromate efflux transporter [Steroidobacteraceae bacterium]
MATEPAPESAQGSAWQVLLAALQLGCRSFGGPIAHLGYFQRSYVQRRRWLDAGEFAEIVALCQVLPGPTSSQVGFLIGWHRAGWRGALAAWVGFTLPSLLLMYAYFVFAPKLAGPAMTLVLQGLKWLTLAVVARAVWSMARTLCPDIPRASMALLAALALSVVHSEWLQVGVLILGAGAGIWFCKDLPVAVSHRTPPVGAHTAWLLIGLGVALLLGLRILALEMPHGLIALADVFYRAGALVFGGGHVVLPLLHDALVPAGWMSNYDFLSGYGAAQVLPGPLFSVAAYFGAKSAPGGAALLGACIATLCLFLPGLLLAIAGRAVWNQGARLPRVRAALKGVNAAAVGILAAALYNPVLTGALSTLK